MQSGAGAKHAKSHRERPLSMIELSSQYAVNGASACSRRISWTRSSIRAKALVHPEIDVGTCSVSTLHLRDDVGSD